MSWKDQDWVTPVSVALKVALGISLLYVGYVFLERSWREPLARDEGRKIELHPDLYVYPKKSYVSSAETARSKLVGKPLWVKEGYRWPYQPSGEYFGPLEKVVPTGVAERDGQTWIEFEKGGKKFSFAIATGRQFWIDEVFFVEDPKVLFSHWTDEMWEKVLNHQVEVGMSEFQVTFALGFGTTVRQSPDARYRLVQFTECRHAGLQPVEVAFRNSVASSIEPLEGPFED